MANLDGGRSRQGGDLPDIADELVSQAAATRERAVAEVRSAVPPTMPPASGWPSRWVGRQSGTWRSRWLWTRRS